MEKPMDWRTRLAVTYVDDSGRQVDVTPIDSFTPTFALNAEVHHSIERTHLGAVFMPESITFSMTVKAIGDVAVEHLIRAAEVAEAGWAKDHAAFLYREALSLIPEEDVERRRAVRRRLAVASIKSMHVPDVRLRGSPQG